MLVRVLYIAHYIKVVDLMWSKSVRSYVLCKLTVAPAVMLNITSVVSNKFILSESQICADAWHSCMGSINVWQAPQFTHVCG